MDNIYGLVFVLILIASTIGAYKGSKAPGSDFNKNYLAILVLTIISTIACVNLYYHWHDSTSGSSQQDTYIPGETYPY